MADHSCLTRECSRLSPIDLAGKWTTGHHFVSQRSWRRYLIEMFKLFAQEDLMSARFVDEIFLEHAPLPVKDNFGFRASEG